MTNTFRWLAIAALAAPAVAQVPIRGAITANGCGRMVDARLEGGELYALKLKNPANGPDDHTDWLFDLGAKGGTSVGGVTEGGSTYDVPPVWRRVQLPSDDMFTIVTFPDGHIAIDSGNVSAGGVFGSIEEQKVGDSLPTGVAAGIGLVLPGTASPYSVDMGNGSPAMFPFGANGAIEVVFAPLAEVNIGTYPAGCNIGSEVPDPQTTFGLIAGYNVYRVTGVPTTVPTRADFMGNWQYYMPYLPFNHDIVNPDPSLPHPAPADPNADGDLVGYQNFDGVRYTGDEILIFQDSANNPDGTPRISGTGPDLTGTTGYWYAFQPVVDSPVPLSAYNGIGFDVSNEFAGNHVIDADMDGFAESIDLDLDGRPEFYSPQASIGLPGLGLTNGDLPLLSAPVFGRANPAVAFGNVALSGTPVSGGADLTLSVGFERSDVLGYNVYRVSPHGPARLVNDGLVVAQGGEASTYRLQDRLPVNRRLARVQDYLVEVVLDGQQARPVGPFSIDVASKLAPRRR